MGRRTIWRTRLPPFPVAKSVRHAYSAVVYEFRHHSALVDVACVKMVWLRRARIESFDVISARFLRHMRMAA